MNTLLEELRLYETVEFDYTLSHTKSILNKENMQSEFIKIANNKISPDFLKNEQKFTLYTFIFKDEKLLLLSKNTFNRLLPNIFSNPKMEGVKNLITDIENNKALKISEYHVKFFIFQKDKKKEQNNFNKLFQVIFDKHNEIKNLYHENYFSDFFETVGTFLIDSYSFFSSKFLILLSTIILYSLYYHKHELTLLGIPSELISDIEILSVLKLYASILIPFFVVLSIGIILIMYLQSISYIKSYLYKSFKVMVSISAYFAISFLIYYFNFFQIKKQNIDINDFFLNQYFSTGFYPRFAVDNNTSNIKLLLGQNKKKYFFYELESIIEDNNHDSICSIIKDNNFEKTILTILKSSKQVGTKKINYTSFSRPHTTLDDKQSFKILKKTYCKKTIEDTN